MQILVALVLFLFGFAVETASSDSQAGWAPYPEAAPAPFVLRAGGEDQIARSGTFPAGNATNVDAGQLVTVERTDKRRLPITLTVRRSDCPERIVARARLAGGASAWRVPDLDADLYDVRVSSGRKSGVFGIAVGGGPQTSEPAC